MTDGTFARYRGDHRGSGSPARRSGTSARPTNSRKPTPPSAKQLDCGAFLAPLDWTDPRHGAITTAVSRLPATSGEADRTVVTNPDGPGAPGRAFSLRLAKQDRVRAAFDIVGLDPRGTGKSANITCGGATEDLDPLDLGTAARRTSS
ncbi:MAG: hypothetical protein ACRDQ7_21260 [Haloechinothrix sp.]